MHFCSALNAFILFYSYLFPFKVLHRCKLWALAYIVLMPDNQKWHNKQNPNKNHLCSLSHNLVTFVDGTCLLNCNYSWNWGCYEWIIWITNFKYESSHTPDLNKICFGKYPFGRPLFLANMAQNKYFLYGPS